MYFNNNHRYSPYPPQYDDVNPTLNRYRAPEEPYFPHPMRSRATPLRPNLVNIDLIDHDQSSNSFFEEQAFFSRDDFPETAYNSFQHHNQPINFFYEEPVAEFFENDWGYNSFEYDSPHYHNIPPAWYCQNPVNYEPDYNHQPLIPQDFPNHHSFKKSKKKVNYKGQKAAALVDKNSQENFVTSSTDKIVVKENKTTPNPNVDVTKKSETTKKIPVAPSKVGDSKIPFLPSPMIPTVPSMPQIPPVTRMLKQKKLEIAETNVAKLPIKEKNGTPVETETLNKIEVSGRGVEFGDAQNVLSEICDKAPKNSEIFEQNISSKGNALPDSLAVNSRKRPRLEEGEIYERESETISKDHLSVLISSSPPTIQLNSPLEPVDSTHIDFGDYIAEMVKNTYWELMKNSDPALIHHKVLAGVVMTWGPKVGEVVALGTGSKCIGGGGLSLEGRALNDCHAEILARRGLMAFLYDQLSDFANDPEWSIFEEAPAGSSDRRLRLKSHIKFHLFVSSAPCGDARIFAYEDLNAANGKFLKMNEPKWKPTSSGPAVPVPLDPADAANPELFYRRRQGVLRTKVEAGEGSIPADEESGIQTWDGILQGERLRTMSCSDKLARWNVVGLQGSLLSHLMLPVYLSTVVVGSLYHHVHLQRALITRVEQVQDLPSSFSVSRPILTTTSEPSFRRAIDSPKHGICWSRGWDRREVIQTASGTLLDGSPSRVSKRSLFERFVSLVTGPSAGEWVNSILLMEPHVSEDGRVSYLTMKRAARDFRQALDRFQTHLTKEGRGRWVKKPIEQDGFEIVFPKRFLE